METRMIIAAMVSAAVCFAGCGNAPADGENGYSQALSEQAGVSKEAGEGVWISQLYCKTGEKAVSMEITEDTDISAISQLHQIEELSLICTSDLQHSLSGSDSIAALSKLKVLHIENLRLTDISFLSELYELEFFSAVDCTIDNEPKTDLSGLKSLERVTVTDCGLTDVEFLSGLDSLEVLTLNNNNITDISMLEGLPQLRSLYLNGNLIERIQLSDSLLSLEYIGLSGNSISDIGELSQVGRALSFDLSDNYISDVSGLSQIKELVSLDLSGNPITDIKPLAKCSSLKSLTLCNNDIEDYSPIGELVGLTALCIEASDCTDFSFISSLSSLQRLELSDNGITDISFLSEAAVTYLILDNNDICDISPLFGIKERIKPEPYPIISLYGNPIESDDVETLRAEIDPENPYNVWFEAPYSP